MGVTAAVARRRWLLTVVLPCFGSAACSPSGPQNAGGTLHAAAPIAVRTVVAGTTEVRTYLTGLGTVAALQTVTVRPLVDGRLQQVHYVEGQTVRRGEELATLDLRPFDIAVRNAEGALMRDRASVRNAALNLQRNHALRRELLISEQAVSDQSALVAQGEGLVRVDEAALELARYQLEQAHVRSPIDGTTGVRQLDAGNLVRAADANGLVVVTQLDPAAVLFTLPEHARVHVARAMAEHNVVAEAFARDENTPVARGEVLVVDNQMAQGSGTVRLKAVLDNPNHALWPGQFVKLLVQLAVLPNTPVIPAAAVQQGSDGPFVYVVDAEGRAQVRAIEPLPLVDGVESCTDATGTRCGEDVPVRQGPAAGEVVVVDGQLRLRPGSLVMVAAPASTSTSTPISPVRP